MPPSIHAVFENGVFRPTQPVNLPERAEVELELRKVALTPSLDAVDTNPGKQLSSGEHDPSANPAHSWDRVFADKLAIRTGDSDDDCQVTTDDLLF